MSEKSTVIEPKFDVESVRQAIEDAEKRIGSWILSGGNSEDRYVKKQIKFVEEIISRMEGSKQIQE